MWRSEKGSVLPLVLGAMVVLTALSIGAWTAASNNYFASNRDKFLLQAFNIAEAGLESGVWAVREKGSTMTFPATLTYALPQGTATVVITPQGWQRYLIVSKGVPSGNPGAIRYVKTSVFYLSLWNFIMGAGSLTAGGGGVNGTTSVTGPFFVRGNLTLSGNSSVDDGPLFVRNGDLNLQGSSRVGQSATPTRVPAFIDGTHPPLTDPAFYVSLSTDVPDVNLPPLRQSEMDTYYTTAKNQSGDQVLGDTSSTAQEDAAPDYWPSVGDWAVPWATSPAYKVVDNDASLGLPVGSGSYGAGLTIGDGTAAFGDQAGQDFAWDPATDILQVHGTVFVDGPVTFTSDLRYNGNGTIVANGPIVVNGKLQAKDAYPSNDVLGLVTPGIMTINTNDTTADMAVQGAFFATQKISFGGNQANIRGSLLSGNLEFDHPNIHIFTDPQLPDFLPKSMPGSGQKLTFPTHWQEGR